MLADLVDDFPAAYGASADAGMRNVLRAVLDEFFTSVEHQVENGSGSVDAWHVGACAAMMRLAGVLDVDFGSRLSGSVAYAAMVRTLRTGAGR